MKTKTTNGVTVVVATEQERQTLDRAIDVLVEYSVRESDLDMKATADSGRESLRAVLFSLGPPKPSPETMATRKPDRMAPDPKKPPAK